MQILGKNGLTDYLTNGQTDEREFIGSFPFGGPIEMLEKWDRTERHTTHTDKPIQQMPSASKPV